MPDLSRLRGNRFVVVGRAGMDFYPDPPGARTETATRFVACLGGSSANIAVAITRQGGTASLVTRVSDDAIGRFVLNELDRYGVDRRHVRPVAGEARTSLAVVESRVEDHQSVIYRNGAADFEMSEDDVAGINYTGFSALVATGTALAAEPSRSATFHAFDLAGAAGLPRILDIDYRPYSWASADEAAAVYSRAGSHCDVIVGNDVEFGFMAGAYDRGLAKARSLVADGAAVAIYKMGEKGSVAITPGHEFRSGVYPATALKPTGAGDSFLGGVLAALAAGRPLEEAVRRGAASAAIVVARVGCAPAMPTTAELDAFLADRADPSVA